MSEENESTNGVALNPSQLWSLLQIASLNVPEISLENWTLTNQSQSINVVAELRLLCPSRVHGAARGVRVQGSLDLELSRFQNVEPVDAIILLDLFVRDLRTRLLANLLTQQQFLDMLEDKSESKLIL